MISVERLTIELNATPLFRDVSYIINKEDRIALVGENGAGKSVVLKILAGLQGPIQGVAATPCDVAISYLLQVIILANNRTVIERVELAFEHIFELQAGLKRMDQELADRTGYGLEECRKLIGRFTYENDRFLVMGGVSFHTDVGCTLLRLGFSRGDFNRPIGEFSGGWRMQIKLTKLLLRKPGVLLLDEPTDHLDIEGVQWLENFLSIRTSAVVLANHDQAFLNDVTIHTIEITCRQIYDYEVKCDEFIVLRQEHREQQLRTCENQQKQTEDTETSVEHFRYRATKAMRVQGRIRQLEKVEWIGVDEVNNSALRLKFVCSGRSSNYPVICEDVKRTYESHVVSRGVNLTINHGEKITSVGKNGKGRSTPVKCVMNKIDYGDRLTLGHNVQIGYFAQSQAQVLGENLTAFDTIDQAIVGDVRLETRDILGAFVFGDETSDKKAEVPSGGECAWLAMIKLSLEPTNFLILDEPTSHSDMHSKDVLKGAIRKFDGTIIIVSRDRDFLDRPATKIYEFGGGVVRGHLGGIYDSLRKKKIENLNELQKNDPLSASPAGGKKEGGAEEGLSENKLSYEVRKESNKKVGKLERQVVDCETAVEQVESTIVILEEKMTTPDDASSMLLYEQHQKLKQQLDHMIEEQERVPMELEEVNEE